MSAEQTELGHAAIEQEGTPSADSNPLSATTLNSANAMNDARPAKPSNPGKVSGAELKKKAKEEKIARRAREKQDKSAPVQQSVAPVSTENQQGERKATGSQPQKNATPESKQHKRVGSASGNQHKQLPIRRTEQQAPPAPQPLKKDNKKVTFFSHLYGSPRRTSIEGAGKDLHPAILNLGIQMSNYVICGSNARCVGMLLAFKRVLEHRCPYCDCD